MSGYLLVRIADLHYGLPLTSVVEVVDNDQVFPVPGAHAAMRGVTAVRGRLVTRIRLAGLIGGSAPGAGGTIAVVTVGGRTVALEVDDAVGILREEPLPPPAGWEAPLTRGVLRHDGAVIPILDLLGVVERVSAAEAEV